MTADLSVLLDQLKDEVEGADGAWLRWPPQTVAALADVAAAAEEHYAAWEHDLGGYDEGQRIVAARLALEAAFARLRLVLAGEEEA